jgi:LysM repeat protein
VTAQAGDTLQGLAAAHHVPVWALAQINRMPEHATLAGGERIIVPRNLAPTAAAATHALSYAPTAR